MTFLARSTPRALARYPLAWHSMARSVVAMALLTVPAWASAAKEASAGAAAASAAAAATSAPAAQAALPRLASDQNALTILVLAGFLCTVFCITVIQLLWASKGDARARPWRLSDAVSEEVNFTDADGHTTTMLVASASRLIAMLGMAVIFSMFIAMGLLTLYAFAVGGLVPDVVDTMLKFLIGGAGLFVPYLANQVRAALERKPSTDPNPKPGATTVPNLTPLKGGRTLS